MADIILKDHKSKIYQVMRTLNPANEMNVSKNIIALSAKGIDVNIEDLESSTEQYWKSLKYVEDTCLHDKLVLNYNKSYPEEESLEIHVR